MLSPRELERADRKRVVAQSLDASTIRATVSFGSRFNSFTAERFHSTVN